LCQPGVCGLPRSFLDVVILFRDQGRGVQALGPFPVEFGVSGVRLGAIQIRERGIQGGIGGDGVSYSRLHRGDSGIDVGRGLHVLELCQQLPLLHAVAFLDMQPDDLAEGIGPDVHVGFGLNFTRRTDHRGQALLLHFPRLHGHQVFPALINSHGNDGDEQQGCANPDQNFLPGLHG
jgi:hypothetical protein